MKARDYAHEKEVMEALLQFDTPSITNVVATYPKNTQNCLGLYHPWKGKWYTDQSLRCMYPELGRRVGYAVTCVYGLPDPDFKRLGLGDVLKAIENSPKPVVLIVKQDFPEEVKKINGLMGGNMLTAFKALGTVGVISDGPSRDLDEIRPMQVQYMLTGVTAGHGDFAVHAVNVPVEVCSMAVCPGEIVHMDENGAVKFPAEYLDEVYARALELQKYEADKQSRISKAKTAEEVMQAMSAAYK
jgi:regulator of RNase E activity RraA